VPGFLRIEQTSSPVLCGELEAFTVDYERRTQGYVIPVGTPKGKKVAIIGAGPAGLGLCGHARPKGLRCHHFRIQARARRIAGVRHSKLQTPKDVWQEKWEEFERAGVKFMPNTYIGKDKTIDGLFEEGFEAVFIGVGSEVDAKMEDTPGTDLPGVYEATDFLIRGNVDPDLLPDNMKQPLEVGRRVAVIGGGDTASDCLRTALRLGAEEVTCLYRRTEKEMPGGKEGPPDGAGRRREIPLPHPAGQIHRRRGRKTCGCGMYRNETRRTGRKRTPQTRPRGRLELQHRSGYRHSGARLLARSHHRQDHPDLETHNWGLIKVKDKATGATSREGVFSGGDCVTGSRLSSSPPWWAAGKPRRH
jgi:glutamate synthase (NADPH) small chain